MANQKIHEYPLERFTFGDDDYYDIDYWDGVTYQTAKILGSTIKAAMLSGIAISLTAPDAFIVGGSPTDGNGTLSLTAAGTANQYIRGDGTLATFPTSGGGGNSVNYYLNGGTAASVGTYFQMSKIPVLGTGVDFSLAGNGLISQWLTDVNDPNVVEIPAGNWNFEMYFSASSSGGTPAFYIEILKYDGTTFTSIANNSANPEGITNGTATDLYVSAVPMPLTTLSPTDRIALRVYIVNSTLGRTIKHHTQDSHLSQIITTFSSGISSINGLTKQTQYLAVGTLGTDFNIDSTTDTHTFHLPTASATKRGALSSADWTTFNGKQNQLTLTTTGSGAATLIGATLNIPVASGGTPAGSTGQIQFNDSGSFGADSSLFWDNTNKRLGVGATPASNVRLDLRAQGALSTDIIQRWRNSADSANLGIITGDGAFTIGTYTNPSTQLTINSSLNFGLYVAGVTGIYAQNQSGSGSRYAIQALGRSAVVGATTYGIRTGADSSVASTTNYGIQAYAYNGTTNYAAYLDSTGGTTNYALYIQRGDILLGTATTNKIGFWNKTPIVQPTTGIAAATFVTNTSGILNDSATFDGYTIGQIVKALRNVGILA